MKSKKKKLKGVSAFAGVGGFEVGMTRTGRIKFPTAIENDEACQRVLEARFPKINLMGDIADVSASAVLRHQSRVDLLTAGFPCKDISIGKGHRKGLAGSESGKFFEFIRLVEETLRLAEDLRNPRWLVLENSADLLRFNGGRDLATVTHLLEQLGYGWAFRVVDARYLGGPAWRRRVFVVGHLGGDPRPAGEVLGLTGPGAAPPATSEDRRPDPRSRPTPVAVGGDLVRVWRKSINPQVSIDKGYEGGYRETWVNDGNANTMTSFDGGNAARQKHLIYQHGRLRTTTLTEWERLLGFPDGWTTPARTEGERFKQLGNAVHTSVPEWLGQRLVDVHDRLPMIRNGLVPA